jgi:maltooligosyltrehalose trehalohydrolase
LFTREAQGYYGDYQRSPRAALARALASGFVYQGEISAFWGNKPRGEPSGKLPPATFVNFLQNHDQIGNRPFGDRLEMLASEEEIEAALAVTLLAPMVPMLFMGEEWGSKAPFPFFCDFEGDLAQAVRKGRKHEYKWAYDRFGDEVPDPLEISTFESAVLDWQSRETPAGAKRLALVRDLLATRRREIVPRLAAARFGEAHADEDGLLAAQWQMGDRAKLRLIANLSSQAIPTASSQITGTPIWGGEPGDRLPPWSVFWHIGD